MRTILQKGKCDDDDDDGVFSTFLQIGTSELSNFFAVKSILGNTYKLAIFVFLRKFLIPFDPISRLSRNCACLTSLINLV